MLGDLVVALFFLIYIQGLVGNFILLLGFKQWASILLIVLLDTIVCFQCSKSLLLQHRDNYPFCVYVDHSFFILPFYILPSLLCVWSTRLATAWTYCNILTGNLFHIDIILPWFPKLSLQNMTAHFLDGSGSSLSCLFLCQTMKQYKVLAWLTESKLPFSKKLIKHLLQLWYVVLSHVCVYYID